MNVTQEVILLETRIANLQRDLDADRRQLKHLQDNCKHVWSEVENADIVTPAYTDPGDAPGTMGIDFRGPTYIPEHRRKRWRRYCPTCRLEQFTTASNKASVVQETPVFS